jgi:hypothetical protein
VLQKQAETETIQKEKPAPTPRRNMGEIRKERYQRTEGGSEIKLD